MGQNRTLRVQILGRVLQFIQRYLVFLLVLQTNAGIVHAAFRCLANMPSFVLLLFITVVTSINDMPLIIKIKEQNGVRSVLIHLNY